MIVQSSSNEQFYSSISGVEVVLVDFFADWCAPCKWLDLILENLDISLPENCSIVKVDVETLPDLASELHIKSVPVLIIFNHGVEVWRMNGFLLEEDLRLKLLEFSRET